MQASTSHTGKRYGHLVVDEVFTKNIDKRKRTYCNCTCDCGNHCTKRLDTLLASPHPSCGCYQRECASKQHYIDSRGYINDFGVEIIEPVEQTGWRVWIYRCRCPHCGGFFNAIPNRVKDNTIKHCGCQTIASSGEFAIQQILDELGVRYAKQYSTPECKDKNRLPFDFAVFDEDKKLQFLIEYDGKQHFEPVEFYGGQEAFEVRVFHDALKNRYCFDNRINLLRYNYTQDYDYIKSDLTKKIQSLKIRRDCHSLDGDI